jgi:hypothetical protein
VILRLYDHDGGDTERLAEFTCSTGLPFEDAVEDWIRHSAVGWVNDVPRSTFQRRALALIEDNEGGLIAVAGWQDIVQVDVEGIWLEVLAVAADCQHSGNGQCVYDLVVDRLSGDVDRLGNHLAGLVHPDNVRSKRLLASVGWRAFTPWDDHELWIGEF